MKTTAVVMLVAAIAMRAPAAELVVRQAQGDVSVRHGVTETWNAVKAGDLLKPDDTMRTGKGGTATVSLRDNDGRLRKSISLPGEVIVEMSDVRDLTQEELMLKLAMERVRSSPYRWKEGELTIPNATVVHGTPPPASPVREESDDGAGNLLLNGARALFAGGFYPTCALRTMDVLRRYPTLGADPENRLLAAEALERAGLRSEALTEYVSIAETEGLSPAMREKVDGRIAALRKSDGSGR